MKIFEALNRVVKNLEALEIPSMLVGSVSSSAYGPARYTQDADFVVQMARDKIGPFLELFAPDFYVDRGQLEQALAAESSFNVIHFQTSFKIDLFILRGDEYSRHEFSRRAMRQIDPETGFQTYVQTAEDALLSKLTWYRKGGEISENQWRDVTGLLKAQGRKFDFAYVEKWAAELGVTDLLGRARQEAGA